MSFFLFFFSLFGNVMKTVSAHQSGPCMLIALQWWQVLQPAPASVRSGCAQTLPMSHPRAGDLVHAGLWPIPHPARAKGTEIRLYQMFLFMTEHTIAHGIRILGQTVQLPVNYLMQVASTIYHQLCPEVFNSKNEAELISEDQYWTYCPD